MKDILLFTFPMNFVCICVTWIYYLHIFPLFQSLFVKRTAAIPILCQSADLLKLSTISRYCISFSIKYFIQENNGNTIHTRETLGHPFTSLFLGALVCTVYLKEKYILKKSISNFLSISDFWLTLRYIFRVKRFALLVRSVPGWTEVKWTSYYLGWKKKFLWIWENVCMIVHFF